MSKRILLVEDTEDNRQIIRDLLLSTGYQLLEAEASPWPPSTGPTSF
jgi:CheY-like chemotaxis protein